MVCQYVAVCSTLLLAVAMAMMLSEMPQYKKMIKTLSETWIG